MEAQERETGRGDDSRGREVEERARGRDEKGRRREEERGKWGRRGGEAP